MCQGDVDAGGHWQLVADDNDYETKFLSSTALKTGRLTLQDMSGSLFAKRVPMRSIKIYENLWGFSYVL